MDQPNNNPQPTETETRPEEGADGALFYSGFPISQQSRLENFMDYGSVLSNNLMEDAPIQMDSRNTDNTIVRDASCEKVVDSLLGKYFDTMEEAYDAYNHYAARRGFGIRKHFSARSRRNGEVIRKEYVCNKEGFKNVVPQTIDHKKRRRDARTGCQAKIEIGQKSGKWVVDKFSDEHNHPLTSPNKVLKHRSHCKYHKSIEGKKLIYDLHAAGLTPSQIMKAVNTLTGTLHEDITAKKCSEVLRTHKRNHVGKECLGIIKHFQEKSGRGDDFYFNVQIDNDGCLRNVFWADERSRTSYLKFGDVMVFDVTYRTNKFKMPFSPFVGVNHHRQSVLFGGALLDDETEETFVWLFEQFLKCMNFKPPQAIITDQDKAIRNAVKRVFPDARHRFCAWHIKKHVLEHIQPFRTRYKDFADTFYIWIKSKSPKEFEEGWKILNEKYKIGEKGWLPTMYKDRRYWVKCYLKNTFFAGMTTSGRSESIHSFFDGYVNATTPLNEFVVQYDKAVAARRKSEEDEDFSTLNSQPALITEHGIEKDAGRYYTRSIFQLFQREWHASLSLEHTKRQISDMLVSYFVGSDREQQTVEYDSEQQIVRCSCAKFETDGILCKHALYILKKKKIKNLPKNYLLYRWTIDARYHMAHKLVESEDAKASDHVVSAEEKWVARTMFHQIIRDADYSPSIFKEFIQTSKIFMVRLRGEREVTENALIVESSIQSQSTCEVSHVELEPTQVTILDPACDKVNKGRPKSASRIPSAIEKIKNYKCSECKRNGHNKTTCPEKKVLPKSFTAYGC
uniref:SWIM-type domain-containing protein n=1 Tax=Kalanchoe fedtschenkoi TaxID=63787 RepID=A0A7N0VE28_KALFE